VHQCQDYINNHFISSGFSNARVLQGAMSARHQQAILSRLSRDAISYYYSSVVTFADALKGLNSGFYSWSTVKLYYSVFYSIRSFLASNSIAIFYLTNRKGPYSINCRAGNFPTKLSGNTHAVVLESFSNFFPNHILLSQDIELTNPCEWLNGKRNRANYQNAKFDEPNIPDHFEFILENTVRRSLSYYLKDDRHLYTFDKDHSMIAYPLQLLKYSKTAIEEENQFCLEHPEHSFLKSLVKDNNGVIPEFSNIV